MLLKYVPRWRCFLVFNLGTFSHFFLILVLLTLQYYPFTFSCHVALKLFLMIYTHFAEFMSFFWGKIYPCVIFFCKLQCFVFLRHISKVSGNFKADESKILSHMVGWMKLCRAYFVNACQNNSYKYHMKFNNCKTNLENVFNL